MKFNFKKMDKNWLIGRKKAQIKKMGDQQQQKTKQKSLKKEE